MQSTATNPADPSRELPLSRGNRRRRVRHLAHTPAYALNSSGEDPAIELQEIVNISEDGVAIQLSVPLQVQEKIDLCLDLAETGAKVKVRGQVVWLDSGKAGIRFPEMPPDAQRKLQEWLFANAMAACEYHAAGDQSAGTATPEPQATQPRTSEPSTPEAEVAAFVADYTATLAALEAVAREVRIAIGGEAALQLIAERAMAFTRATGSAIALAAENELVCRATAGPDAPSLGMRFHAGEGFSGECVRAGKTLRCDDSETDPRVDRDICRALGVRSLMATPVGGRQPILGLLEVFSPRPNAFHVHDEEVLERLAAMIPDAVYRARLSAKNPAQASVRVVDDEVYTVAPEESASHRIPIPNGLLLIIAALTLIPVLVWLLAPWNFGSNPKPAPKPAPSQQQPETPTKKAELVGPQDFAGLRQLAERGDPAAQFAVGAHYATGEDVPQDYTEAMRWFTLAADQGHVGAQATLGAYYLAGRGSPQDLSKAYFWALLAQTGGDDASRYRVAFLASRMSRAQIVGAQQRAEEWIKAHESASAASPSTGQKN